MLSILCPSRQRPELCKRMYDSALRTALGKIEILVGVDSDDPKLQEYQSLIPEVTVIESGKTVGQIWNILASKCNGDMLMMGNDDLVYVTECWDVLVAREAMQHEDKIYLAWCNDGTINRGNHAAFPIVSRTWYETLGYFTPEIFNFLWHDTWLFDIGKRINRLVYLNNVLIEHHHFTTKLLPYDLTYARHRDGDAAREQRRQDQETFGNTANVRAADALKLQGVMRDTGI